MRRASSPILLPRLTKVKDILTQHTFTCSKSTIETLEKGVKYAQN